MGSKETTKVITTSGNQVYSNGKLVGNYGNETAAKAAAAEYSGGSGNMAGNSDGSTLAEVRAATKPANVAAVAEQAKQAGMGAPISGNAKAAQRQGLETPEQTMARIKGQTGLSGAGPSSAGYNPSAPSSTAFPPITPATPPAKTPSIVPTPTRPITTTSDVRSDAASNKQAATDIQSNLEIGNATATAQAAANKAGVIAPDEDQAGAAKVDAANAAIDQINASIDQIDAGNYTDAQKEQIKSAMENAKARYQPIIDEAKNAKTQGEAKSLVAAGQQGGLMNTQFAGVAALLPTNGGTFAGAGGELERIHSAYDQNIANATNAMNAAVEQARTDAVGAIFDSSYKSLARAEDSYNRAVDAHKETLRIAQDKAKAIADFNTKNIELQKFNRDGLDKTIDALAKSDMPAESIPDYYFKDLDAQSGYQPGTSALMFDAARKVSTAKTADDQLTAASKLVGVLKDLPVGKTITIGDSTYSSLNKGTLSTGTETGADGKTYQWSFNQDTGEKKVNYIGDFGNQKYTDIKSNEGAVLRLFEDGTQRVMFDPRQPNGGVASGGMVDLFPENSVTPFTRPDDPNKDRASECGAWVNDMTGIGVGDTFSSKKAKMDTSITSDTAEIGDVFLQPYGTTGHVGIINGKSVVDGKTYFTVSESNWQKVPGTNGTVGAITHTRQVPADNIAGFARPGLAHPIYNFGTGASDASLHPDLNGLTFGETQKNTGPDLSKEEKDKIATSDEGKKLIAFKNMNNYLDEYEKIVKDVGVETLPTASKTKLEQLQKLMIVEQKNISGLGALANADIGLVNAIIPIATTDLFKGLATRSAMAPFNAVGIGQTQGNVQAQIEGLRKANQAAQTNAVNDLKAQYTGKENDPYLQQLFGTQNSTIRVKLKNGGATGTIFASEFDPNLYEKIQ